MGLKNWVAAAVTGAIGLTTALVAVFVAAIGK